MWVLFWDIILVKIIVTPEFQVHNWDINIVDIWRYWFIGWCIPDNALWAHTLNFSNPVDLLPRLSQIKQRKLFFHGALSHILKGIFCSFFFTNWGLEYDPVRKVILKGRLKIII